MSLKQLEDLKLIDQDVIDEQQGRHYDKRSTADLLDNGIILLDKPPGPTSHEVVAWTKRMLDLPKIGHSGTLDPQVSGVLPLGLGNATKALGVLLFGSKEYVGIGRFHTVPSPKILDYLKNTFTGPIYQKPPQRSSVLRRTRVRTIHEIEIMETKDSLVLMRTVSGEIVQCIHSLMHMQYGRRVAMTQNSGYVKPYYYDLFQTHAPVFPLILHLHPLWQLQVLRPACKHKISFFQIR